MNLKNYTSSVPASQTIAYIEAYLAGCGVTAIAKDYDNGKPIALFFRVNFGNREYTIRLPARIDRVQEFLWQEYCASVSKPRKAKEDFSEQATRTAWKIQQDWVQVQMSLIKLKQVDFLEVFMGFVWDGNQSYFQLLESRDMKALSFGDKS